MAREYTLAIDLGTTNSVAAVFDEMRPKVLPIQGSAPQDMMRSVVLIESPDRILVGETAWNLRGRYPERFISSVKSRMGTDWIYEIDGVRYTSEEISSFILKEIIERAKLSLERNGGGEALIRNLVITVPARFSLKARHATQRAAELAGYPAGDWNEPNTHELFNEPAAAALTYIHQNPQRQTVLVYDLGGGTFDATLLQFRGEGGEGELFSIEGPPAGDPRLGGDAFDRRLIERMVEHFNQRDGALPETRDYPDYLDLTSDPPASVDSATWADAQQRFADAARGLKEQLCQPLVAGDIPFEAMLPEVLDRRQTEPFRMTLDEFHALIADDIAATGREVERLLKAIPRRPEDVDRVVLAGGSSLVPAVATELKRIFGTEPNASLDPARSIAIGAAIHGELRKLLDPPPPPMPVDLGIRVTRRQEVQILGPAATKSSEIADAFEVVVPVGTPLPAIASKRVTTTRDGQRTMLFQIYQNDDPGSERTCRPDDLYSCLELRLPEAAIGPRGTAVVELTFSVNRQATELDITAREVTTGALVTSSMSLKETGTDLQCLEETGSGQVDIVVAMDTTASMQPWIDRMQEHTMAFADTLASSGVDFRLAAIDFKDLRRNEAMRAYPFTDSVSGFKKTVAGMTAFGGGDQPESALDAIAKALEMPGRDDVQRVVILITDAPAHDPGQNGLTLDALAGRLASERAALYVVSTVQFRRKQYQRLIESAANGQFFEMGRPFDAVLHDIATEIRDISVV
jgi:molecular chaperone DnaK